MISRLNETALTVGIRCVLFASHGCKGLAEDGVFQIVAGAVDGSVRVHCRDLITRFLNHERTVFSGVHFPFFL